MNPDLMHDLRMPLQLITGCAQLLEEELSDNPRARDYLDMLMRSANQMQHMLAGELERLRPEAGETHWTRSDLVARVWEIFVRCRLYAERKGIKLTFHANTDRLPMALDDEKLSRILLNLLSNALKFTPPGGCVRLEVRALGDTAEVEVSDNGCGMDEHRLRALFTPGTTDFGHGYGLTIARTFATQLDGLLTARSKPGAGSTFVLRLPVRSVEAAVG